MDISIQTIRRILEKDKSIPMESLASQYLSLLAQLSPTTNQDLSLSTFQTKIQEIHQYADIYVAIVRSNQIVGAATIFYEAKLIHGGNKYVGHIEDVVVDRAWRGNQIGQQLLNVMLYDAERLHDCYKVILDCEEELADSFYGRVGFQRKCIQMAKYFI